MKNKLLILLAIVFMAPLASKADEGMWLLNMMERMNYKDMQKCGVKLTAEQIYSINNSSLKDAIGWFSNGCTSEIVSDQGLVLTNHHCGYDAIAGLSTAKDNILDNGFWAKSKAEERPAPGVTLALVVAIKDITNEVMDSIKGMDAATVNKNLNRIYRTITKRATEGNHYEAQCRQMFNGNAYYLFTFERFSDVRLVGTPPQNIGKYGGDTDNWMWPRHTGDFSVFRVYSDKDGKPAPYSADNIPYKPKSHLKVTTSGVKTGDYAMIMGFPGRTDRYMFSQGVKMATDYKNPTIVKLRDIRLKAWKAEMNKDTDVRLSLASDYASVANYWKYFDGEAAQLKNNKVADIKRKQESKFGKWAKDKDEYKTVLGDVEKAYTEYTPTSNQYWYWREGIIAPTIAKLAYYASLLADAEEAGNEARVKGLKSALGKIVEEMPYGEAVVRADKIIMSGILKTYNADNKVEDQPKWFRDNIEAYKADNFDAGIDAFVATAFESSIFADKDMAMAWFKNPRMALIKNDIMYQYIQAFKTNYDTKFKAKRDEFNEKEQELSRLYIKGLIEQNPKTNYYPDANSSMRLTYGKVKPYMNYKVMTYLDGVIEKNKKFGDNPEFSLPQNLIDAYNNKDFGNYTDKTGKVPVCFLTDNDITGGNSGSPVMDAKGRLIGLAFDGNWEAMSGNISYNAKNQRTIVVDIRYVLWIMDKLGGATNLIDEMKIDNTKI
jgi:hypothetical protein